MSLVLILQIRLDTHGCMDSEDTAKALEDTARRFRKHRYVETVVEKPEEQITRAVLDGHARSVGQFILRDSE